MSNSKNNLIYKYAGIFETEYFDYITNSIYINKDQQIIARNEANSDFEKWFLDSVYYYVKKNDRIRSYFELRGFELGFKATHVKLDISSPLFVS